MLAKHLPSERQQGKTSTIKSYKAIEHDILRCLFDPIIDGEPFKCWWSGIDEPQLRLHGGPGSGKTTFVSVAAELLRKHKATVVTVFIQTPNACNQNTLRDIMHCVLDQLLPHANDHHPPKSYSQQSKSDIRGHICKVIAQRLIEPSPLFLLVDGCDSSDFHFHKSLEEELSKLQELGVKILLTSRHNCALTTSFFCPRSCDFCVSEVPLEVYWECKRGHTACPGCFHGFLAPEMCTYKDQGCLDGHSEDEQRMTHPYQYNVIDMNKALRPEMEDLIVWNLENEHGDLGLGVSGANKIPFSKLGLQLRERKSNNTARAIVYRVKEIAEGNVAMARLRLDILHGLNDVDLIEAQVGITPSSVTTILSLAFNSTQNKSVPLPQRTLALKAMAIVSRVNHWMGVSLDTVRNLIGLSEGEEDGSHSSVVLSVDDIAFSTKGLLVFDLDISALYAYNQAFHMYLNEANKSVESMVAKLGSVLEKSGQSWEHLIEREERREITEEA